MTAEDIAAALAAPIEGPQLHERAAGSRSACLVVDDLARPTRVAEILPHVLKELDSAGLSRDSITILVATGSHGGLSDPELARKIGHEAFETCRVESHDCRERVAGTGIQYGDAELQVNPSFLQSDFKLVIGSVLPHSFAGYSGGAKLVLPGLADLTSIARSHKFVQLGLRGGNNPDENRFRTEAESIARQLGLEFAICVVPGGNGETVGLYAGDLVAAHRAACRAAQDVYRTPIQKTYDCAILNAFPKDIDLVQAENAFIAWKTARQPVVADGGVIVLASAASTGIGTHGLFEPGGQSYRPPQPKRWLRNRELWIYCPSLTADEVHTLYWDGYPAFSAPEALAAALQKRLPADASIGVFPCAPIQQVDDRRN